MSAIKFVLQLNIIWGDFVYICSAATKCNAQRDALTHFDLSLLMLSVAIDTIYNLFDNLLSSVNLGQSDRRLLFTMLVFIWSYLIENHLFFLEVPYVPMCQLVLFSCSLFSFCLLKSVLSISTFSGQCHIVNP